MILDIKLMDDSFSKDSFPSKEHIFKTKGKDTDQFVMYDV